ncbi:MAG TPA: NapC/NirT family cytochrome c, partial [Anaerolineales bacterium]|nr:NapC/NirT family cytochrome c [Anaerolineales bacterium]
MIKKFFAKIRNFFFPPHGTPRRMLILPYSVLGLLTLAVLVGGAYGWEYTNSSEFCGTSCHTMPPEYASYQVSPHARIACVECHIGREFIGNQIFRKAGDVRHIVAMTFQTYEYPIRSKHMRPAPEICEQCHSPEKFSDDSLRTITRYHPDQTEYNIYLVLKTGGGSKREGLGRGIHWHIENPVYYYPVDNEKQIIPYVKVVQEDGSEVEYIDVEADFDVSTMDETKLEQMDCITCHNRITHRIYTPEESMDNALSLGRISSEIPGIWDLGVKYLRGSYTSQDQALDTIAQLDAYYQNNFPDYYAANSANIEVAIAEIQNIYVESVYLEQKVDWDSHPNNVGHMASPGCFRCHDGGHLNTDQEAIRLECNLCHSIPTVADQQDFLAEIEISRGPEPESHLNPNWISLHNEAFGESCSACHTMGDPGGISNTSFCSNSACHGNVYTFAGFDAPSLREVLQAQLPSVLPKEVAPDVPTLSGDPTFDNYVGVLIEVRCS